MKQGLDIDWLSFRAAGKSGILFKFLSRLSRERWVERDEYTYTILHYACLGPNIAAVKALLQSGLVDMNARTKWRDTPVHLTASHNQSRMLEVLCAAGADLRSINSDSYAPIDEALDFSHLECVRVLVANGVRLSTLRKGLYKRITQELETFERGVLRCRKAVIAMLRLKKAAQLWHVDRYLIREIGFAIWATRYENIWQN